MYITKLFVYMHDTIRALEGDHSMPTASRRTHKHFQLDAGKIRRAQKVLKTKTETETIEQALDRVIEGERTNQVLRQATERFLKSGIEIKDVYGVLDEQ
jgi:hypothetical protein